MTGSTEPPSFSWEDTLPQFSTVEKPGRITVADPQPSENLRFFITVTFIPWVLVSAGAAFWVHGLASGDQSTWLGIIVFVGAFLPLLLTAIVADEARDTFGQRRTGIWFALTPTLAAVVVGLLGSALWFDAAFRTVVVLIAVLCAVAAAIAALMARWGIRYTRRRQAWMASLRRHGVRSSGVLRQVQFRTRWTDGNPEFTVTVDFDGRHGRRTVTANMLARPEQVPLAGSALIVFSMPHDVGSDVLIELDPEHPPKFDRDPDRRSRKPTGN